MSDSFESILAAQGSALERMDAQSGKSLTAFGLGEFISEMSFSKSGLLGMSALKSSNGVEVKWRRTDAPLADDKNIDIEIKGKLLPGDLNSLVQVIMSLFRVSGDARNLMKIKKNLLIALQTVNDHLNDIHANQYKKWKADSMRIDLHFGLGTTVFYVVTPGANFRVRLNWKINDRPLLRASQVTETYQTKFVIKMLNEIDQAIQNNQIKDFDLNKVLIGMGASDKKKLFTIWNVNVGFIGWLGFIPRPQVPKKEIVVPEEILNEDFEIGGEDENVSFLGRRKLPARQIRTGMQASVESASRLADRAGSSRSGNWLVDEIKTIHEISKTGMFGFGGTIKRGVVEIDFKRKDSSIPRPMIPGADSITILGFDGRKTRITKVPVQQYVTTLTESKLALDQQAIAPLGNFARGSAWNMTKFSLGIGTQGEIGIGPWTLGKAIKQRYFYRRRFSPLVSFISGQRNFIESRANTYSRILENPDFLGGIAVWDQFLIRCIIQLGVTIPYVTTASVNPEIEFYFERK